MIFRQVENFFPRLDLILPEIRKIKLYSEDEYNKFYNTKESWPGLRSKIGVPGEYMGTISKIHDWSGIIMALLVFIHLAFHWNWIVEKTKHIFFKKK